MKWIGAAIALALLIKLLPYLLAGAATWLLIAAATRHRKRKPPPTPAPTPAPPDDPLRYLTPADRAWLHPHLNPERNPR